MAGASPDWENMYEKFISQGENVQKLLDDPDWYERVEAGDPQANGDYHDAIVRDMNNAYARYRGETGRRGGVAKIPSVRHAFAVHYSKTLDFAIEDAGKSEAVRRRLLGDIRGLAGVTDEGVESADKRYAERTGGGEIEEAPISELRRLRGAYRGGFVRSSIAALGRIVIIDFVS